MKDADSTAEAVLVIGLYQNPQGKVLTPLTRSDAWTTQMWRITGGGVEPSETPEQAAIREKNEEVGLFVNELHLFQSYEKPSRSPLHKAHVQHVFFGVIPTISGFKTHAKDGEEHLTNELFLIEDVVRTLPHRGFLSGYQILGAHAKILQQSFNKIFG